MKYEVLSARLEPAVLGWDQNCFVFVKNESGNIDQFVVSRHGEILDAGDIATIPKDLQEAVKASAREAFESELNQLATVENLLVSTQHFFNRHWNRQSIGHEPPQWSAPFPIKEDSPIPNHDKQGVYAFVNGDVHRCWYLKRLWTLPGARRWKTVSSLCEVREWTVSGRG